MMMLPFFNSSIIRLSDSNMVVISPLSRSLIIVQRPDRREWILGIAKNRTNDTPLLQVTCPTAICRNSWFLRILVASNRKGRTMEEEKPQVSTFHIHHSKRSPCSTQRELL